eukprot:TRINITY_DN1999_c0_g2_i1.p1 TRINITY_DN1999_c0_g2~~TRINITY_DN1999_c0_g2_i1.p1  ORF type:complete len:536 (+),score=124.94 TRINITY_DN1999_c0_g2_i1:98-1705(+)
MGAESWLVWTPSQKRALAYAMTNFSAAVLNNVFITYYVEMAVSVSKVSEGWFLTAQVLYCIWNSINDPACGWYADNNAVKTSDGVFQRRIPRIRRGGPLWALSFLLMWFPWGNGADNPVLSGLHLIFCLVCYDGWMSYTLVNHQALMADMTTDNEERERCNMYGAACQIMGSFAVFLAGVFWDVGSLWRFQLFTVLTALTSCVGFAWTSSSQYISESSGHTSSQSPKTLAPEMPTLKQYVKQTVSHKNLWAFLGMAFLQQFSCTFSTNFFSLFLTLLVGKFLTPTQMSLLIYASFVIPHLGTIALTPVLQYASKKAVIMTLFVLRLVVGVTGLWLASSLLNLSPLSLLFVTEVSKATVDAPVLGVIHRVTGSNPDSIASGAGMKMIAADEYTNTVDDRTVGLLVAVVSASLLLCRVLIENVCRLEPLLITDLIDEDCVIHKRRHLMSSVMFGAVALFSKPAQSLAPILGYYFISRASTTQVGLWLTALSLTFLVPIFVTVLEIVVWAQYGLSGSHLDFVKTALKHDFSHDAAAFV